ncbi:MAG TPA: beta-ketoacyl-ACP synthase II, partial [Polyangiaceae bacterium]|nr:beta-ketoacyl-ACP synthase II [Polyangiaceae bacterium]
MEHPAPGHIPPRENMERVVVTGIGLVTPLGNSTQTTWEGAVGGRSGAALITLFPCGEEYPTRIACEVKDFDPTLYLERKKLKEVARFIPFSLGATRMAIEQADLQLSEEERETVGVYIGVGLGGIEFLERCTLTVETKGPTKVTPYTIPALIANMAAGRISIDYGFKGPTFCHTSACSSSAHAIGEAMRVVQSGRADVMIAGGAEATVSPVGISGFSAMFALSRRNAEPERASRPWDRGRDGFVVGEGAGTLVLESLTRARRRGARILGEIRGYGATSDAFHITKPSPDGEGGARAMRLALKDAGLAPEAIDYINAHGTSTPAGDVEESKAVAQVFGAHALDHRLWVSSTKS